MSDHPDYIKQELKKYYDDGRKSGDLCVFLEVLADRADKINCVEDPDLKEWMNVAVREVVDTYPQNVAYFIAQAKDADPNPVSYLDEDVILKTLGIMLARDNMDVYPDFLPTIQKTAGQNPAFMQDASGIVALGLNELVDERMAERVRDDARGAFTLADSIVSVLHDLYPTPEFLKQSYAPIAKYLDFDISKIPEEVEITDRDIDEGLASKLLQSIFEECAVGKDDFTLDYDATRENLKAKIYVSEFEKALRDYPILYHGVKMECLARPDLYPHATEFFGKMTPPALEHQPT